MSDPNEALGVAIEEESNWRVGGVSYLLFPNIKSWHMYCSGTRNFFQGVPETPCMLHDICQGTHSIEIISAFQNMLLLSN